MTLELREKSLEMAWDKLSNILSVSSPDAVDPAIDVIFSTADKIYNFLNDVPSPIKVGFDKHPFHVSPSPLVNISQMDNITKNTTSNNPEVEQEPQKTPTLTPKQTDCLGVMCALHADGVTLTPPAIYEGLENITPAGLRYILAVLDKGGYIRSKYVTSKLTIYTPILKPDGTPVIETQSITNAGGITITKCPTAYAAGFGFDRIKLEQ